MHPDLNLTAKEIKSQVNRICQSDEINTKLQLCKLLRYIVDETLAGRSEFLKGYTIGINVYGKEDHFDPDQDPLVRIHAGRLRRMLKLYYLGAGANDPVVIDIPKGKYIPTFVSNVTTPEDFQQNIKIKKNTEYKLNPTVAVLPFKNLSGNKEQNFFAIGFSEEISVELTKFEDLTVHSSSASYGADFSESDKIVLFRDRKIHFVIEGGVQLGNEQVRILVKLIDVNNNEQVWAERYLVDYTSKDLINIQSYIAREVACVLGSEYGVIMHRLTLESNRIQPKNTDTYNAILKFHYFEAVQSTEAAMQAFSALEEALKIEPDSGIVTAMLSSMYFNRYMLDIGDSDHAYRLMNELAEKAIVMDAFSLSVRVVYVMKHFACNERDKCFNEIEKCLKRDLGGSLRLGALGMYLSLYGEWERGKTILDKVMNSNIQYPLYLLGATTLYFYRKREYEKALVEAEKYVLPTLFWGPLLRVAILGQLNRLKEVKPNIAHLKKLKPDFENKAEYLISRFTKEKDLVEHVIDGLKKAGMVLQ